MKIPAKKEIERWEHQDMWRPWKLSIQIRFSHIETNTFLRSNTKSIFRKTGSVLQLRPVKRTRGPPIVSSLKSLLSVDLWWRRPHAVLIKVFSIKHGRKLDRERKLPYPYSKPNVSSSEFGPFHAINPSSRLTTDLKGFSKRASLKRQLFHDTDTKNLYGLSD